MKKEYPGWLDDLRRKAEALARGEHPSGQMGTDQLLHELSVHQAELEIQNEQLRETQLQLEDSRDQYISLYDLAPIGYLTIDPHASVSRANLKMAEMLGVERAKLIGFPFSRFVAEEDYRVYYSHINKTLGSGEIQVCELRLRAQDGTDVWVQMQSVSELFLHGSRPQLRAAIVDIKERKQAEQALQQEAQRKDEFLAMLAHELRNPLAPIRNALELLRLHSAGDPLIERECERIARQTHHMSRLLDDLLDMSRITHGKIQLRKMRMDLREAADSAVQAHERQMRERELQFTFDRPPEPVWIYADPTRIEQVINNLLVNTVKYTNPGGSVCLSLTAIPSQRDGSAPKAVLRLRDTGIGISAEMLPRVFDMFAQAGQSLDRPYGGLGLGLTLVRDLIGLHGGSVRAESGGVGCGSEFIVELPISMSPVDTKPECARTEQSGAAAAGPSGGASPAKRFRVLIVDDIQDTALSLADVLQFWGHETCVAFDGRTALSEVKRFQPDIVLLDIGLPGENGYEVARLVRQGEHGDSIFLAALTGYGGPEDAARSREAGFNLHLVKPVDPAELKQVFQRLAEDAARRV